MVFKSGVVFVMSCSKGGVKKSCPSRDFSIRLNNAAQHLGYFYSVLRHTKCKITKNQR